MTPDIGESTLESPSERSENCDLGGVNAIWSFGECWDCVDLGQKKAFDSPSGEWEWGLGVHVPWFCNYKQL